MILSRLLLHHFILLKCVAACRAACLSFYDMIPCYAMNDCFSKHLFLCHYIEAIRFSKRAFSVLIFRAASKCQFSLISCGFQALFLCQKSKIRAWIFSRFFLWNEKKENPARKIAGKNNSKKFLKKVLTASKSCAILDLS